ncbi:MAG: dethiobiotin synthase [Planctomycetes bacterium]|nr:dethiobiotin synthase [Planctomycetota bacterium]NOG55815.1 dethiobiotin synthase [Planctomycetota bacterium]
MKMMTFFDLPQRTRPGLFVTGIDTAVGKTVVTCAIAEYLSRAGLKVGVCKPFATGCRSERGNLVSDDAEALAHYAQLSPEVGGLGLVAPASYKPEAAPAVSMELAGCPLDVSPLRRSLATLDEHCDVILVEGSGGLMLPIDPQRPNVTQLDLVREMGYPAIVVSNAGHSALSHTTMTAAMLRQAMCPTAGLVANFYEPDHPDPSHQANAAWLSRLTLLPVLATIPRVAEGQAEVSAGRLHDDIRAAIVMTDWRHVVRRPTPVTQQTSPGSGPGWITYQQPRG